MFDRRLLTCLLLLAPSGAAQISQSQGISQVKAAAKAALKTYKAETKETLGELEAALEAVDAALAEDSTAAEVVADVGAAVASWLADVDAALFVSTDAIGVSVAIALDDMGVPTGGDIPETFAYGTSGLLDDSFAKLRKAAAKAGGAAEKRIRKTMSKAEKESGIALALTLQYPRALDFMAIETDDTAFAGIGAELEVLLAGSRTDADGDGVVFVAGNSDFDSPDVELELVGPNGDLDNATAVFLAGPFTFTATMNDAGGGLDEGVYLVTVTQGGDPARGVLGIGVR